ncbi:5-hydroxyisourate hydrolase [Streptomyces sp. DvalAA-14]|uniref:hydroxyisourate hydrolase n=1 Tax=unclassified Streptomyces TaxID=2593676 RepID=UPI00081BB6A0|nr:MULTISPECIES: hydroxyisourate hydrolase [unclassified Streptomyces]MYS24766.1 hydroxyisourate hydrolase [Streptomyces sp. SID4948]SCE49150.1 5-hydroxyisourate hydrolase [Streptomyces sp. DvalAA-14]
MTSVSTHILDTGTGRPAAGVAVELSARTAPDAAWTRHGAAATGADGRCKDWPALPAAAVQARLRFEVEPYFRASRGAAFFPEVAVVFAVVPGEHHHVPLLLSPFGYSVYRGS